MFSQEKIFNKIETVNDTQTLQVHEIDTLSLQSENSFVLIKNLINQNDNDKNRKQKLIRHFKVLEPFCLIVTSLRR